MSQHPTNKEVLLIGLQDDGSVTRDASHFGPNETRWYDMAGGDGGYNAINQTDTTKWYTSYVYTDIFVCAGGDTAGNCITDPNFHCKIANASGKSYFCPDLAS